MLPIPTSIPPFAGNFGVDVWLRLFAQEINPPVRKALYEAAEVRKGNHGRRRSRDKKAMVATKWNVTKKKHAILKHAIWNL